MSEFGYQDLAHRQFLALVRGAQAPIIHISTPKRNNYCYFYIAHPSWRNQKSMLFATLMLTSSAQAESLLGFAVINCPYERWSAYKKLTRAGLLSHTELRRLKWGRDTWGEDNSSWGQLSMLWRILSVSVWFCMMQHELGGRNVCFSMDGWKLRILLGKTVKFRLEGGLDITWLCSQISCYFLTICDFTCLRRYMPQLSNVDSPQSPLTFTCIKNILFVQHVCSVSVRDGQWERGREDGGGKE